MPPEAQFWDFLEFYRIGVAESPAVTRTVTTGRSKNVRDRYREWSRYKDIPRRIALLAEPREMTLDSRSGLVQSVFTLSECPTLAS
jgi:hypothetical protein